MSYTDSFNQMTEYPILNEDAFRAHVDADCRVGKGLIWIRGELVRGLSALVQTKIRVETTTAHMGMGIDRGPFTPEHCACNTFWA